LQSRGITVTVVPQDRYLRATECTTLKCDGETHSIPQWEAPSACMWDKFRAAIEKSCQSDVNVVIAEGYLLYHPPEMAKVPFALPFFLDVPYELSYERRVKTCNNKQQGPAEFDQVTWPCYQRYGQARPSHTIVLDAGVPFPELMKTIVQEADRRLNTPYVFDPAIDALALAISQQKRAVLIGVGGATRSGKSSCANRLAVHCEDHGLTASIICQDCFLNPENLTEIMVDNEMRKVANFEEPAACVWGLFKEAIREALISGVDVLIVEGFLLYHPEEMGQVPFSLSFFLDVPYELAYERRVCTEYPNMQSAEEFNQVTWPSYQKYGRAWPEEAIVLDAGVPHEELVLQVIREFDDAWSATDSEV